MWTKKATTTTHHDKMCKSHKLPLYVCVFFQYVPRLQTYIYHCTIKCSCDMILIFFGFCGHTNNTRLLLNDAESHFSHLLIERFTTNWNLKRLILLSDSFHIEHGWFCVFFIANWNVQSKPKSKSISSSIKKQKKPFGLFVQCVFTAICVFF